MKWLTIKEILMQRDGYTEVEADSRINDAIDELGILLDMGDLDAAEGVCWDFFGLEPDYIMELL